MALPSSTVENYLKAIFQAQLRLREATDLVPMGQLAGALGVVPGNRDDDGQDAGRVGAGQVRALRRRPADGVGREARRAGGPAAPVDRTVSREGDGHELDRGSRGSGTARARGVGSADRADRRDARASGGRSARRPDSGPGRRRRTAAARHAADLPAATRGSPSAASPIRIRSSCASSSAATSSPARSSKSRSATPPPTACAARTQGPRDHDRRPRGLEGARAARDERRDDPAAGRQRPSRRRRAPAAAPPAVEPFEILDNSFLVEEAFNQGRGIFQNIFGFVRQDGNWAAGVHAGVAGADGAPPVVLHRRPRHPSGS